MKQRTGAPAELAANSCGGMVSTVNTWLALWEVSHGIEGDQGYITSWQLPGPPGVFAEKDISQALSFSNGTGGENTTFKLVNPPLNSNQ
jgi:hypothetical protein